MTDDDFVRMIKELQKKIEYEEGKIYSKAVVDEYHNPNHFGVLKNPDTVAQIKGSCGDTMKFSLKIKNKVIDEACFWTDGCGATIASGNMLTKIILGKNLKEASAVTSKHLISALDGLPKENLHCAVLAVNTLRKSIENYYMKNHEK